MDSRNSLPWSGYSSWATSTPGPPTRNTSMFKRSRSDTEDCDDAYSDHSSKEQCSSPGDADSCQLKSRKKRRGIIEKRRRDRINSSLGELRRLVPTAYEKQGSAKLEKAEILQMTVEYLKMLQARGCNSLAYESSKFAMDYHNIGFQECIAEVSKFLSIEGMEIHDSLRMRLMSHLHNVTAQREFASKQTSWYPATPPPPPPPPSAAMPPNTSQPYQSSSYHLPRPLAPSIPLPGTGLAHHNASLDSSSTTLELSSASSLNSSNNTHSINSSFETSSGNGNCEPAAPPSTTPSSTSPVIRPLTSVSSSDGYNYLHHNGHQHSMELYHHHPQHVHPANSYGQTQSDPKPYRPWGAEVAY